eukprot:gene5995-9993_t
MIVILILFQFFIINKSKITKNEKKFELDIHSDEYIHRFDTDNSFEKLKNQRLPYQMTRDFKTSPILIYFNNSNIKTNDTFGEDILCDIPCKITKKINVKNLFIIDGFLMENKIPPKTPTNRQKTLFITNDNDSHLIKLMKKKFHFTISSNFESTITNNPFGYKKFNYFKKLYNGKRKVACSFIKNCEENEVIKGFKSNGIQVDCFKEKEMNEIIIEKYFFNIILEDKLTDNFFKTISSGTIPIYKGVKNIKFFEPQNDFILYLDSEKLIEKMKNIMSDMNLFQSKFKWKQFLNENLKNDFRMILDDDSIENYCKICQKLGDTFQLDQQINDEILIRERNTFQFKILKYKNDGNFENFKNSILNLFGSNYLPTWSKFRSFESLKISKIYELADSGTTTLDELFYGEMIESMKNIQKGKRGEILVHQMKFFRNPKERTKQFLESLIFENTELKKENVFTLLTVATVIIFILITIILNGVFAIRLRPAINTMKITVNNIQMNVIQSGKFGDDVLCLHGFPDGWSIFSNLIPKLNTEFKLYIPDLRGYNETSKPKNLDEYHVDYFIKDMEELISFIQKQNGNRKVYLMGHDFGGLLAMIYANKHPEKVSGLIIINSPHPNIMQYLWKNDKNERKSNQFILDLLKYEEIKKNETIKNLDDSMKKYKFYNQFQRNMYLEKWNDDLNSTINFFKKNFIGDNLETMKTTFPNSVKVSNPTLLIWSELDTKFSTNYLNLFLAYFSRIIKIERYNLNHYLLKESESNDFIQISNVIKSFLREFY